MHILKLDPRALNENADDARQSKLSARLITSIIFPS
jgi:hypothetical protein